MPEEIEIPSLTIVDFEGDTLDITIQNRNSGKLFWIDMKKSSLVFTNEEELRKLANFILENIKS